MAYVRDYNLAFNSSDVDTHTANMPQHETDDILFWFITKDTNAGGDFSTPSGWTNLFHNSSNASIRSAVFYKTATSSSESAPSTTSTDTDAWSSIMVSVVDADTSDIINGSNNAANSSSYSPASPSLTTDEDNCLLLYFIGADGNGVVPLLDLGYMHETSNTPISSMSINSGFGWGVQETAGAVPTPTWRKSASGVTVTAVIAINNATNGGIPSYQSPSNSPGTYIADFNLNTYSDGSHGYAAATTTLRLATVGSKTTAYTTARGSNPAFGCDTYEWCAGFDCSTATTSDAMGLDWTFTSVKDMSAGLLACTFYCGNPEDAKAQIETISNDGLLVVFVDSSDNYRAFNVYGRNSNPQMDQRLTCLINPRQSTTAYATSATAPDFTDIENMMILVTTTGSQTIRLHPSEMHLIDKVTAVGGSSSKPMEISDLIKILNHFRCKLGQAPTAAAVLSYSPIQIGDGSITTYADIRNSALQFPRIFSEAYKEITYHGQADNLGISYYGVSGDTIKHRDSIISSPSQYYWKIHASATSAATYDFSGLTVVGANVTLRDVTTFNAMSFKQCTAIDASSCDLANCVISGLSGDGDLTVDGSTTFDTCSFNTTSLAAGDAMTVLSDPSIFTDCTFTGSSSTGHAIEIDTPGTYSLVGNTFTGYGSNGTTSAAIYNNSGGAVTLNISGGGSTPTYYNGASASTTVNNTVSVTVTVKRASNLAAIENARVLVEADTGGDLPAEDSVTITRSSSTATVTHTGHGLANGDTVIIRGAAQDEYNGTHTITYIDANSYSYTVSGTPDTPATGTITSTAVILSGLTDSNGVVEDTGFNYTSDQPITGTVRKAGSSPYFKPGQVTGTITSTGFSTNVLLILDE